MASEYWKNTQKLFSTILIFTPLLEKYLKRPSPKYIFALVINTMQKTGFPKGLFTLKEENIEYFMADLNHKKEFLKKVIDITKIITKINFDVDIDNIVKGLEPEKTNIFLPNFYKVATTKTDFKPIIDIYLIDMENKKSMVKKQNKI